MNKPQKSIASAVAFWVATIVSISLFGLLSAWAMNELGPAQQEAIAAINTPWIPAQRDAALVPTKPDAPVRRGAKKEHSATMSIATRQ